MDPPAPSPDRAPAYTPPPDMQTRRLQRDERIREMGQAPAPQVSQAEAQQCQAYMNKALSDIDKLRYPCTLPTLQVDSDRDGDSSFTGRKETHAGGQGPEEITLPLGKKNTVTMGGMRIIDLEFTKRSDAEHTRMRKEFESHYRKNFLKELAGDPDKLKALRQGGLTSVDIEMMQDGKVPPGYQVHHKIPIDDSGENDFSNFVLIKNYPAHIALTNLQRRETADMAEGESRHLRWPVPDGFIYPPDSAMIAVNPG
jgi:hypothetical protein